MSQSARCAPLFGLDATVEDGTYLVPLEATRFDIENLGPKKILALAHLNQSALTTCGTSTKPNPPYFFFGANDEFAFPKPEFSKWEVRDVHVVQMIRKPQYATGYCYSKRLLYIDDETHVPWVYDLWDTAGKLWKLELDGFSPDEDLTGGQLYGAAGSDYGFYANFLDSHASYFVGLRDCIDSDCNSSYSDITRYALPQGLMKIVQ